MPLPPVGGPPTPMRLLLFLLVFSASLACPAQASLPPCRPATPPDSLGRCRVAGAGGGRAVAPPTRAALPVAPPRFLVDVNASNRNAYLNRAPEAADDHGYLATLLTYQTRWGGFGSVYLNHSFGPGAEFIDDTETSLGYARAAGATEWSVQYTHLFVNAGSGLLKGSITDNLEGSLSHDFDLVQASLTADGFLGGKRRDVNLTGALGHSFYLPAFGTDTLAISPTVEVGLGTQHFYAAELTRAVRHRTGTFRKSKTTTTLDTPAAPGFGLTGYTFSVPLTLDNGRSTFSLTPAYLVPVRVPEWGNGEKLFYVTLGYVRRFW